MFKTGETFYKWLIAIVFVIRISVIWYCFEFRASYFGFKICFEFRASDFEFLIAPIGLPAPAPPSGLSWNPARWTSCLCIQGQASSTGQTRGHFGWEKSARDMSAPASWTASSSAACHIVLQTSPKKNYPNMLCALLGKRAFGASDIYFTQNCSKHKWVKLPKTALSGNG